MPMLGPDLYLLSFGMCGGLKERSLRALWASEGDRPALPSPSRWNKHVADASKPAEKEGKDGEVHPTN